MAGKCVSCQSECALPGGQQMRGICCVTAHRSVVVGESAGKVVRAVSGLVRIALLGGDPANGLHCGERKLLWEEWDRGAGASAVAG